MATGLLSKSTTPKSAGELNAKRFCLTFGIGLRTANWNQQRHKADNQQGRKMQGSKKIRTKKTAGLMLCRSVSPFLQGRYD
jgi:hypothetical protein